MTNQVRYRSEEFHKDSKAVHSFRAFPTGHTDGHWCLLNHTEHDHTRILKIKHSLGNFKLKANQ